MLKWRGFNSVSEVWTRPTLLSSFLVANSFVWYFVILIALKNSVEKILSVDQALIPWIWTIHFSSLVISAIIGASITGRIGRSRILISWMVLTGIASGTLLFLASSDAQTIGLAGFILGAIFGFGMPSCMSLFSDSASVERRGRVSGITILITGIGLLVFSFAEIGEGPLLVSVMAVWRVLSLAAFFLVKSPNRTQPSTQIRSYREIVFQKSFLLYLIPWLMFSLVNYITAPMVTTGTSINREIMILQAGFTGVFGIIGGFLVDSLGRKKVAISGFVLLGIGTAILAISLPEWKTFTQYFNAIVDGIAWGFLLVLFLLTLWGDLSDSSKSEKYYALGAAPFFVSKLLEATIGPDLGERVAENSYAFFSFTTFFLFIAILPLVYAPETLPEKVMKERDLKSYVEKAKKKMQKETENTQGKKDTPQPENYEKITEPPPAENGKEYEEAEKLAEKYY